jgi:acetyltransferase-like isoleucine patch superfamily enzyme
VELIVRKNIPTDSVLDYCDIGEFCEFGGGVTLHPDNNHACVYDKNLVASFNFHKWDDNYPKPGGVKRTVIGNDVWFGEGSAVLIGVTIGDGAIIGAHAVVAKDVPPYAIVVGNPAVIKGYRFTPSQIKSLLRIKWWTWDTDYIKEHIEDFKNIKTFIKKYG